MLDYKLTNFSNGLRVITAPLKQTRAVTILVLIGVGSRYEETRLSGISHFLEHMFYKGTDSRPTALDIAKSLDSVGADYNAFTSEEQTGFYIRCASEHFDLALDILDDILYHSKFDEKEIEKEKTVITEEINMRQDVPQEQVAEVLKKLVYDGHPLSREITGQKETIKQFKRDDLLNYKEKFYQPSRMIVAVAGGGEETEWLDKIRKKFEAVEEKKTPDFERFHPLQKNPLTKIHERKTDQTHLMMAFHTVSVKDPRWHTWRVMNNLLGESMSSRLFTEIREKRGLAYYIHAAMGEFSDNGIMVIAAGVNLSKIDEAIKVILGEITRIKTQPIDTDELQRAKENLKGRLYLSLEESFNVAEYLANEELLLGKIDDPDTLINKYEKVTSEDLQKFANDFFVSKNLNLAMIGPLKNSQKYQNLLNNF